MVDVIKASSPVPKLFQFFAALQYQLHVFLKKADLCLRISYDELKSIALESGKINYAVLLKETNLLLRLCAWSFANIHEFSERAQSSLTIRYLVTRVLKGAIDASTKL